MEHLPRPRDPKISRPRIPFVGPHSYDGSDFLRYPERSHWEIRTTTKGIDFTCCGVQPSVERLSNFLQQWLYFGLLKEAVGNALTNSALKSLVEQDEHGRGYLNSTYLEKIIGPWSFDFAVQEWAQDVDKFVLWGEQLNKCLLKSRDIVIRVLNNNHRAIDPLIFLGIALLAEYLTAALKSVYIIRSTLRSDPSLAYKPSSNQTSEQLSPPVSQTWRVIGTADCGQLILHLMLEHGWCPHDVARFDHQVREVGVLWYYASLEPPRVQKDHSQCSPEVCLGMQTEKDKYPFAHWRNDCTCVMMDEHAESVNVILKSGSLPLVDHAWRNDKIEILIVPEEEKPEFVAISHVWSDGFGNPKDNVLNTCVFEAICRIVDQLPKRPSQLTTPFWIDTVCVPLRPQAIKDIAFQKLRDPYDRAQHVLVIDSYLRTTKSRGLSPLEIFARVSCTSWMQRLWTFQEGRLGKRVWICFDDQTIELCSVFSVWMKKFTRLPASPAHYIELSILCGYSASKIQESPVYQGSDTFDNVGILRQALSSRLVSYKADEAVCLASLMVMDIKPIYNAEGKERMRVFWSQIPKVPTGLAFSRAPRKLLFAGYRWAPATLLGFLPPNRWAGGPKICYELTACPTSNGLLSVYPGFVFSDRLVKADIAAHESSYHGVFDRETRQLLFRVNDPAVWYACTLLEGWAEGRGDPKGYQSLALVLPRAPGTQARNKSTTDGFQKVDSEYGVLVCIQKRTDKMYVVEGHNHILLEQFGSDESCILQAASECAYQLLAVHGIPVQEGCMVLDADQRELCRQASRSYIEQNEALCTNWAAHYNVTSYVEAWIFKNFYFLVKDSFQLGTRNVVVCVSDTQQWCID